MVHRNHYLPLWQLCRTIWNKSSTSVRCNIISNVVFWILSLLGLCADHLVGSATVNTKSFSSQSKTKIVQILLRCKLQPHKSITGRDRKDLVFLTSFNMLFVSFFICCPIYEWVWNQIQGTHRLSESQDPWNWPNELLFKLPVHMVMTDMAFYVIHCLLHHSPLLYRYIHKMHHRFTAPTVMACVYAHPIEFVVGNVLPIYLGPIFTNAHPKTCYIWWALAMLGTCKGHSGYQIFGHADYHEEHHLVNKYNYGGIGLMDYLCGTKIILCTKKQLETTKFCSGRDNKNPNTNMKNQPF